MHRFLPVLVLLAGALCSGALAADPPGSPAWPQWQEARVLYDTGKYDEALAALRAAPSEDASFYYNLGTIYQKLGQLGPAVAHLEKANRLRPHDPDIQYNLKLAKDALGRLIGPDKLVAGSWTESIADRAPLDEIRAVLGLLAFILASIWLVTYLRARRLSRALLHPASLLVLLALLASTGLYAAQRLAGQKPPAACLEQQPVRSGPGDQFAELARLEAGQVIRLLGPAADSPVGQWKQVRYDGSNVGWIKAASLLPL